ncbi:UPF0547 protein C16orf87 homolog isoform X2 [Megalops cyprinoides]|uniref:UPF0547 protein C16orf87 homolog isoform X2 n=1 Tax=Megalops cyprinoides TaxID=118141 RepID=UPI0018639FE3|nr:UPF0547 protein C16orf87 homolog isoform X2 [Megalops cyprinoides]
MFRWACSGWKFVNNIIVYEEILFVVAYVRQNIMSAIKAKKVKMATKLCPECDQQIPVACKSCPCGYVFISRKLLNAKLTERTPPGIDKLDAKRRRTERIRREKINSTSTNDMENRRQSRSNSQSEQIRRGRGRPKTTAQKKQEEEKEKQEKEIDIYANLSDEKAFVFSVALAEINRKILGQRLIL